MKSHQILVTFLLLSLATCSFDYETKVVVSNRTVEIEYSPEQNYLLMATPTQLDIF